MNACGYWLYRYLAKKGLLCWVVAPSLNLGVDPTVAAPSLMKRRARSGSVLICQRGASSLPAWLVQGVQQSLDLLHAERSDLLEDRQRLLVHLLRPVQLAAHPVDGP